MEQISNYAWVVGIGVGIINIVLFGWRLYADKQLRKLVLKDDFWFRTLILPEVIKPVGDFLAQQSKKLRDTKSNNFGHYLNNEFLPEYESVVAKCHTLHIYSKPLYEEVTNTLDELQDKVANFCCSKEQVDEPNTNSETTPQSTDIYSLFPATNAKIIKLIKDFHEAHLFK